MMTISNFPNGISSFGVPVLGGTSVPTTTGEYFFVHSGTGVDADDGKSPDTAKATIDAANNAATASQGDVIIVMPGHAENITAATDLVLDKAGITIIGLGHGRNRPVLTFTATASRIPISADNVVVSNLVLDASIASIVSAVTVTGDNVILDNIEWNFDATGIEFLIMLDIDTTERVTVQNCKFIAENIAGTNTGIRLDTANYTRILNNEFRGDFTTAAISGTAGSAAASTDVVVRGNLIENLDTTAGLLLDIHDSGTGIVTLNQGFTLFATAPETAFDPGNALNTENYVVNAVDESGTIVPITLST
jgi:hypothetical protein